MYCDWIWCTTQHSQFRHKTDNAEAISHLCRRERPWVRSKTGCPRRDRHDELACNWDLWFTNATLPSPITYITVSINNFKFFFGFIAVGEQNTNNFRNFCSFYDKTKRYKKKKKTVGKYLCCIWSTIGTFSLCSVFRCSNDGAWLLLLIVCIVWKCPGLVLKLKFVLKENADEWLDVCVAIVDTWLEYNL